MVLNRSGLLADNPLLIEGRKTLPAKNLKELIAWLRANPDKASWAPQAGSNVACGGVFSEGDRYAFSIRALSWRRAGDARLVAGQIDLFRQASNSLP